MSALYLKCLTRSAGKIACARVPSPGALFRAMWPPCASMKLRTRYRPNPIPPCLLAWPELSSWTNASRARSISFNSMPGPWSIISMISPLVSSSRLILTVISLSTGEYLSALLHKLKMTCRHRRGSARRVTSFGRCGKTIRPTLLGIPLLSGRMSRFRFARCLGSCR